MTVTGIRNAALIAAACGLAACADSTTGPARAIATGGGARFNEAGGQQKVDVCHRTPKGYHKITVGAPAVRAHLAHGDLIPGTLVQMATGYALVTDDCQLQPIGSPV